MGSTLTRDIKYWGKAQTWEQGALGWNLDFATSQLETWASYFNTPCLALPHMYNGLLRGLNELILMEHLGRGPESPPSVL